MKAPRFWYQPPGLMAYALSPLSLLYRAGGAVRKGRATPAKAKVPVICVGNIVAGGSGKTPTAIALADLLKQKGAAPVFVTRGYGGSEAGPLRVDVAHHTADQVGDEAFLLARIAPVWIGRDRAAAIHAAENDATHIILDDGLQNPHIAPDIALLVIDAASGLGNGHLIPSGPLRENLSSALQRISAVILIGEGKAQGFDPKALPEHIPVITAKLQPDFPANFLHQENFLAFAGIGRPEKFYTLCRAARLNLIGTQDFADHHAFSNDELAALKKAAASSSARLLTTEKDFVRLPMEWQRQISTLPIQLMFDDATALMALIP